MSWKIRHPHRHKRHASPTNQMLYDDATKAERIADRTSAFLGSWPFLSYQTAFIAVYVVVFGFVLRLDVYPFIFLTLLLSLQAAYAAPIILLAANRAAERDRLHAEQTWNYSQETHSMQHQQLELLAQITANTTPKPRAATRKSAP